MRYFLPFTDESSSTTQDAWKTLCAVRNPDTAGIRCRVDEIKLGLSDDTPADKNLEFRLIRKPDTTAGINGTATAITAGNVPKGDPLSRDPTTVFERTFTVEPTSLDAEPLDTFALNDRNAVFNPSSVGGWVANRKQALYLQVAVRSAPGGVASKVSGTMVVEEF